MVVLPAPFGPSRAKIVPSATSRSMPSSTTLSPYDLRSPPTMIADRDAGVAMSLLRFRTERDTDYRDTS